MKQDEIIEMARQAQQESFVGDKGHWFKMELKDLERFAKLVAAKEREQFILLLRNLADDHTPSDCADMICALQSLGAIRARGET